MRNGAAENVLGLVFGGKNPAACLLSGGRIAAFNEEERFAGVKHADGLFPARAAAACLRQAGLGLSDVSVVAVPWSPEKYRRLPEALKPPPGTAPANAAADGWIKKRTAYFTEENLRAVIAEGLRLPVSGGPAIRFYPHHLAHAACAFGLSGFRESLVLTADGHGEEDCAGAWLASLEDGAAKFRQLRQVDLPHSLGWLYTSLTAFLGFEPHDGEGKLMGLAAYGRPSADLEKAVARLLRSDAASGAYSLAPGLAFGPRTKSPHYPDSYLELFGPPRGAGDPITGRHQDLAFAAQAALERAAGAFAAKALADSGARRLCLAGGVHLNCKLNMELSRLPGVEEIFAAPVAGDSGTALGAALLASEAGGRLDWDGGLCWGVSFSDEEVEQALRERGGRLEFRRVRDPAAEAAALLARNGVVGWFSGRMEAGPRALGARSILANPGDPGARDRVNAAVKFRELWRPFCPSVLAEHYDEFFEPVRGNDAHMIVATRVHRDKAALIPSVVHVDGTVRPQRVSRAVSPVYWRLIAEFRRLTGLPLVLNTSFNAKGRPIVCSPRDAADCFLGSPGMDALVLENFVARKRGAA